jgi:hypothetical protein
MKSELKTTNNCLRDVITWLKEGHIISLYSYSINKQIYFFSKETLEEIGDEFVIYIDLQKDTSLLNDDEWPWYIKNEGFVEYKSVDILPVNENNIYNYKL